MSIGMTSPNPTLASQMSAASRSSLSPKKARPGRPSKRKSRVVKSDFQAVSPHTVESNANFNENPSIEYSEAAGRNTKRVETLEYIEQLFQNEGPLGLRSLNHCNTSPHMEYEPYRPPLLSRHRSVDPRDIELKPCYNSQEENMITVGPLQFFATLKSQCADASNKDDEVNDDNRDSKSLKSKKCKRGRQSNHCKKIDKVGKTSKCSGSRQTNSSNVINTETININKRKLNGTGPASSTLELSLDETKGLVDSANEQNDFVNPESPASPLTSERMVINSVEESLNQELESISLSMLADTSSNYCHVSSSSLTEVDAIPRTFNRVIGASDSASYSTRGNGQFLSPDAPNAMSGLPSQVVNTRDLYEELSFYMH